MSEQIRQCGSQPDAKSQTQSKPKASELVTFAQVPVGTRLSSGVSWYEKVDDFTAKVLDSEGQYDVGTFMSMAPNEEFEYFEFPPKRYRNDGSNPNYPYAPTPSVEELALQVAHKDELIADLTVALKQIEESLPKYSSGAYAARAALAKAEGRSL